MCFESVGNLIPVLFYYSTRFQQVFQARSFSKNPSLLFSVLKRILNSPNSIEIEQDRFGFVNSRGRRYLWTKLMEVGLVSA